MRRIIVATAAVLVLGGCGSAGILGSSSPDTARGPLPVGPPPHETAYTRNIIQGDMRRALSGSDVEPAPDQEQVAHVPCGLLMEDVPDGLALVFTAHKGESVSALRQRVRQIAERYNRRDPDAQQLTQDLMNEKDHVSASASEHSVPGGARLVLSTSRPNEVGALRALMRWHAADLLPGIGAEIGRTGPCPSLPKPIMG